MTTRNPGELSLARRLLDPGVVPWSRRTEWVFEATVLVLFAVLVAYTASHHEMWRDEVRALTFATTGDSFAAMLRNLREGHPAGWYLLLRAGHAIIGDAALPVLSGAAAVAGAGIVLRLSPFSPAQKVMLVAGTFFAYEYSVMSRNYGIGALLILLIVALHDWRFARPMAWGGLLALLANTSVHAAIIALAFMAGWAWEAVRDRDRRGTLRATHAAGFVIALAGVAMCIYVSRPPSNTVASNLDAVTAGTVAAALVRSVVEPGAFFAQLVPLPFRSWYWSIWSVVAPLIAGTVFILAAFGLRRRPALLLTFVAALIGLATFFRIGYTGYLRHIGLFYFVLVGLYWLVLRELPHASPGRRRAIAVMFTIPLTCMMFIQAIDGVVLAARDVALPASSSKVFGKLLQQPRYANAIVIGEADYRIESIVYYAPNRMYLPRLGAFSRYAYFTSAERPELSLGELLAAADSVGRADGSVVLIAISHPFETEAGKEQFGYGHTFTWTSEERQVFLARAREVARFSGALSDENYVVYELVQRREP